MTIPRIDAVGFCAHYSTQGDQAFDYALHMVQAHDLQLNVFHFLVDPYDPGAERERPCSSQELSRLAFERERELRLYYDERAGDYLEVGFRLCFDDSWRELHRCLAVREFQLLILARPAADSWFCGKPIEVFADSFVCPVVLVGEEGPVRYRLNSSAALIADRLSLDRDSWSRIETAEIDSAAS